MTLCVWVTGGVAYLGLNLCEPFKVSDLNLGARGKMLWNGTV